MAKLGVSTDAIDQIIQMLYAKYRIPAKITGAGGGGCLLAMLPESFASLDLGLLNEDVRIYCPASETFVVDTSDEGITFETNQYE